MRTPIAAPRAPAPSADGGGQDRQGLALLLGAVGLCAVIGVATARARCHRAAPKPDYSTPPGVDYPDERDDPLEWS